MEVIFKEKSTNEFVHTVILSTYRKWTCYCHNWYKNWILCMRIILLPTDTEFEEEHPYVTLIIKCACFKNTNIDSECNEFIWNIVH